MNSTADQFFDIALFRLTNCRLSPLHVLILSIIYSPQGLYTLGRMGSEWHLLKD